MLNQAFISMIQQRFSHEKRARVCLWFDPAGDFERLLPVFEAHLAGQEPTPFSLLVYEKKTKHGQLWLKRKVWEGLQESPDNRFVIYLPFPEERITTPDESGKNQLSLLIEFQVRGVDWKIGGKRPSLFSFLKAAGAVLPESIGVQRKLTDGGKDSLLAKYAAKFASKPAGFWSEAVTPELAQSRLLGDVDQALLDLAVEPQAKWAEMEEKGHLSEFVAAVGERLGALPDTDNPELWIRGVVERLALTEAFAGYGEPDDFPFGDRIPPSRYRENHVNLVRRWLRDANCRGAWDRWVADAEQHINLKSWAKGRTGACYGLPHLVSLRWQDTVKLLAYPKEEHESWGGRVSEAMEGIKREAEYAKASPQPAESWETLLGFTQFIKATERARSTAGKASSASEFLRVYLDFAGEVDGAHLKLKREAQEMGLSDLAKVIDRTYAGYTKLLNQGFFERYTAQDGLEIPGLPFATTHVDAHLWSGKSKRAVVIVDALRYDCALRLKELLAGCEVRVDSMRAMLPTITPFGMSALLPSQCEPTGLRAKEGSRLPEKDGIDLSQRKNRLKLMEDFGAGTKAMDDLDAASEKPKRLSRLLVVYGHEEVDQLGHGSGDALIRHVEKELARVSRVIRKLHDWGYPEVHVVTDHGFVLLDEENLPEEVPLEPDWCLMRKERFALVPAEADLPVKTKPMPWDGSVRVAIPPGLAFFKAEKSFSHGGATLQEMVIPHLVSKVRAVQQKVGVEILLAGAGSNLSAAAVKLVLRPVNLAEEGELGLGGLPRNLLLDVARTQKGEIQSILPGGNAKLVELPAAGEKPVTLFFDSKFSIQQGEQLSLTVTDVDTGEQFPGPGGITLTAARNL